jgi:hypothetical protein
VVTADLTIEITRRGLCFSASKQNENLSFEPDSNIQETDLEAYRIDPSLTEAQRQDLIATVIGENIPLRFYDTENLLALRDQNLNVVLNTAPELLNTLQGPSPLPVAPLLRAAYQPKGLMGLKIAGVMLMWSVTWTLFHQSQA